MRSIKSIGLTVLLATAAMAGAIGSGLAQSPHPASPAPVDGARAYTKHCAACHGPDLRGAVGPNEGSPLSGEAFVAKWKAAPPGALQRYIETSMPLSQPGGLDRPTYAAIGDYIRAANRLPGGVAVTDPAPVKGGAVAVTEALIAGGSEPDPAFQDATYHAARKRLAARAQRLTPVTDAQLADPPEQDWLAWRRTSATLGFSPLRQIDRGNVGRLGLAWSLSLGTGTNGIGPLVHDGVMFVNSSGVVRALDARNGDPIWEYARPATATRVPSSQTRSMTLYGDNLYVSTVDGHVIALGARSGKLIWDREIVSAADDLQLVAAPLAARGKIFQGVSGCQGEGYPGGCFIVALDAATGKEAWRFHTIARPGKPGGDTWNDAPLDRRFGGSVWTTGSYDPELDLVFFGAGQTYIVSPLLAPNTSGQSRDALYTNTTLALDPDTGRLVWHYQHAPGDVWDLDWAFERSIVKLRTPNGLRKAVVTSGKLGIIDAIDARTGKYLWSRDLGVQNLVTAIDPRTGRKSYDPALTPEVGKFKDVCPGAIGARNWPSTAIDPNAGLMFVPMTRTCMGIGLAADKSTNPTFRTFGEFVTERRIAPNIDGLYGQISAVDLKTRKIVWTNRYRAPHSSAVLATAGGVLFEGSRDRWFRALDSTTGNTLWQTRLDNSPNGFPITYMIDGRQYVAIVTGGGTAVDLSFLKYTPEIPNPAGGRTLVVFALPEDNERGFGLITHSPRAGLFMLAIAAIGLLLGFVLGMRLRKERTEPTGP